MSWSIAYTGTDREALKSKVDAEHYIPPAIKQALKDQIDLMALRSDQSSILVKSHGHGDSASLTCEISVVQVLDVGAPPPAGVGG